MGDPAPRSPGDAKRAWSAQDNAKWHKLGTIERLIRYHGGPNGTPSMGAKGVGVILLTYANTAHDEPYVSVGERRIAAELGVDAKTLRRHLDALERRRWVRVERDRKHGGTTYYVAGLVRAFTDPQPPREPEKKVLPFRAPNGQDARSDGSVADGVRPGILSPNSGHPVQSDRASCPPDATERPVSLEHVEHLVTHNQHTALARRFGLDPEFFAHRPRRFAAAHLIADRLTAWGVNVDHGKRRDRELRKLTGDYGFTGLAGAIGYVLGEIERGAQALLIGDDPVRKPGAMLRAALEREWTGTIPGFEDDPFSPRAGGASVEADLWAYALALLDRRVPRHTLEVGFAHAKLRRDGETFVVVVRDAFAATIARSAADKVRWAFEFIGYPNAVVTFTTEGA